MGYVVLWRMNFIVVLFSTVLPRKLGDLGYGDLENMPVFTRTVTWLRGFPMLQIRIATWLW